MFLSYCNENYRYYNKTCNYTHSCINRYPRWLIHVNYIYNRNVEFLSTQTLIENLERKLSILSKSKKLVVLGVGNSIRMDDGAGIRVVEQLEQDETLKHLEISFQYLNTGGLDILDAIDGFEHAIIVDAASMADQGLKPGDLFYLENLNEIDIRQSSGISSHGVGVLPVLKYAKMGGYKVPNPIEIYGVQIKEIGFISEELTPEVRKGVNKLIPKLKKHILSLF